MACGAWRAGVHQRHSRRRLLRGQLDVPRPPTTVPGARPARCGLRTRLDMLCHCTVLQVPKLLPGSPLASACACVLLECFTLSISSTIASVWPPSWVCTVCVQALECCAGPTALELYEALTSIQQQRTDDPFGWVVEVV